MLRFNLFPEGKKRALTMSYDDGSTSDRRLIERMNRYGLRCTVHLNTCTEENAWYVPNEEYRALYEGHEISAHGHRHPDYNQLPLEAVVPDLMENKRILEESAGYPVRGMSYPFARFTPELARLFRGCGMEYARTATDTSALGKFECPTDFMVWNPTCHHSGALALLPKFLDTWYDNQLTLMMIWGHSFEFDRDGNWDVLESIGRQAGGREDVWYATNVEVMDYVLAVRSLKISVDGRLYFNNSRLDIWATEGKRGRPVCIASGKMYTDEN